MPPENLLDTRTVTYRELIANGKTYFVPPFQRDYSWSRDQWDDLWNDLVDLQSGGNKRHHYLGALVVEQTDDRSISIIDGQQRLATLSVLALAAVHRLMKLADDGFEANQNKERARMLRDRFIGEKDPASLTESSRLRLNRTDDGFYQDYLIQMRRPRILRSLPRSNRLLFECFEYFSQRIRGGSLVLNTGGDVARFLSDIVAEKLVFIKIRVSDELNAYTVFETLNARVVELTTTDLLKNYLFSRVKAGSDLESLQRRWQHLVDTVGQEKFPRFLRYHLACEERKVRGSRVFTLLRERARTPDEVFSLLDILEIRGDLFAAMHDTNHEFWTPLPQALPYVAELDLFGIRQPMPLLFAAHEKFSKSDFVRILKLVAAISFRYTVVSRLGANDLEPVYHHAAKAIADGNACRPGYVFNLLRSIYVSDEKFQQDFSELTIPTSGRGRKRVKYILVKIEMHMSKLNTDPFTAPVTLEHILPEHPSDGWSETYPPTKWEDDAHRLGNLTLLEAPRNREAGSASYAVKCELYADSDYALSTQIPEMAPEEWSPVMVAARQRRLAEAAARIWRSDFA